MTLITRITRLFKADIHGVLDCLEEPEMVVRQAIREMEEQIGQGEGELRRLDQEGRRLQEEEKQGEGELIELERQIKLCFEAENEDLAKALIRKKLERVKQMRALLTQLKSCEERKSGLMQTISDQRAQLEQIAQKLELFSAKGRSGGATPEHGSPTVSVKEDEIEIAFLEEKRKYRARSEEKTTAATL